MIQKMFGAIFDLDGVIVDTARFHYLAWQRLANSLGFEFSEKENERLKGVSRDRSLEILLEIGNLTFEKEKKKQLTILKNDWYVEYINQIDSSTLLEGSVEYIRFLRGRGIKTAIGSASKNTPLILDRLGIQPLFDAVIDGNKVSKAKPDPEVFLLAAEELGIKPENCVVFEDAEAGIQAALRAGMGAIGIGKPSDLIEADIIVRGLWQLMLLF